MLSAEANSCHGGCSPTLLTESYQTVPCSRCCRFKVERYMQLVFGLSSLLLFVPVLYNRTEQGGNKSREG